MVRRRPLYDELDTFDKVHVEGVTDKDPASSRLMAQPENTLLPVAAV